ncbi:MAG: hypothetical protein ACK4NX_02695, partial [Candidatus Paceibacteria bacterium]
MDKITPEALKKIREAEIEALAQKKAAKLGLPYINLASYPIKPEAIRVLSLDEARLASCVVFEKNKKGFRLALTDPANPNARLIISNLKKLGNVEVFITSERGLDRFLKAKAALPKERKEIRDEL